MGTKLATRAIFTITNNKVIFDKFCLSDYEIDQTPISRYSGRSFSEQSKGPLHMNPVVQGLVGKQT